jgi:PiT family inorganic phosphate transporter
MSADLTLVVVIIIFALAFDYINGFHDAANSIATVVSTRVLSPGLAVIWAAFFNFIAFLVYGQKVAKAVGDGVNMKALQPDIRLYVILAALIGAIIWNLITWYLGLPTSSSHALLGGYGGSAIAAYFAGTAVTGYTDGALGLLKWEIWRKILLFIVGAPLIGMTMGIILMIVVMWIFRRWSPNQVDGFFRRGQLISAAAYSLGHGGNDAQKTMGIITAALIAGNYLAPAADGGLPKVPWLVVLGAQLAIGLGTLSGGWRIVHTMGSKITKLKPVGGFCAETAGALTLFGVTQLGIPVSTTHTITGAIVGVGSTRRLSAVKWGVAGRIIWAWVLTIPAAATIAALSFGVIHFLHNLQK